MIDKFLEGQVVIKVDGEIAACALSIIVNYEDAEVYAYKADAVLDMDESMNGH